MAQQGNSNLKFIALAVVCVVLIASTVGAFALYLPTQTQITEKDQTIASSKPADSGVATTNRCSTQHQHLYSPNRSPTITNSRIQRYINKLSTEYQNLQKIADLATYGNLYSSNFSQDLNATTTLWSGNIDYAGYIVVEGTSNVTSTYVQVTNVFSSTYTLASNQTLGASGTLVFAVLPGTLEVKVGNINEAAASKRHSSLPLLNQHSFLFLTAK